MKKYGRAVKKLVIGSMIFTLVSVVITGIRYIIVSRKIKERPDTHNQMHSLTFGNGTVSVGEDTQNAYVTDICGSMVINVEELPKSKELNIDLFALLGKVTLLVPAGAEIDYQGRHFGEKVKDARFSDNGERTYKVHVNKKNFLTRFVVIAK